MFSSVGAGGRFAPIADVSCLRVAAFLLMLCGAVSLSAATLEQLTFNQMTAEATDVIYGRVLISKASWRSDSIYTHYSVQVIERWKGTNAQVIDVVLPGGEANGLRQTFAGVPQLDVGREYVMFLWTGPSGKTQLLGLTQGLFEISQSAAGEMMASRGVSSELMLDKSGKAVQDQGIRMRLQEMGTRVKTLSKGKAPQ